MTDRELDDIRTRVNARALALGKACEVTGHINARSDYDVLEAAKKFYDFLVEPLNPEISNSGKKANISHIRSVPETDLRN